VPAYKLNVVAEGGTAVHIATTETAMEALSVLRGTAHFHSRVWITDQDGNDVSEDQLIERAAAEAPRLTRSSSTVHPSVTAGTISSLLCFGVDPWCREAVTVRPLRVAGPFIPSSPGPRACHIPRPPRADAASLGRPAPDGQGGGFAPPVRGNIEPWRARRRGRF
jgi:hypothetical protein